MRVLVTGACGQLGADLLTELVLQGIEAVGTDIFPQAAELPQAVLYRSLDLTDDEAVQRLVREIRPDALIHCAAWTAVDAAEEAENRERVFAINAAGTRSLALACRTIGCKMLYISTDYVFDGQGTEPWQADSEAYAPLNVYGQSKLAGEEAVRELVERAFIVRIAWLFGGRGNHFVRTMLRLGKTRDSVRVVNDQIGTPTYTVDLAKLLADIIRTEHYGVYHATNEGGFISWFDFTREIYRLAGLHTELQPVSTAAYGLQKAKRPCNSRLDKSKLTQKGFARLPSWQDALARYLKSIGELQDE